ncbi:MAG: hypothetical protein V7720_05900 [Halioglobus sp.]
MKRNLFTLILSIAALSISGLTAATETSLPETATAPEQATIIVYRADESIKTRRIGLDIHVDTASVGRLNAKDALLASGEPGTYVIGTSMPGDIALELELKPGATHYVHTRMRMIGNRVVVELVEVEAQVAKSHQVDDTQVMLAI